MPALAGGRDAVLCRETIETRRTGGNTIVVGSGSLSRRKPGTQCPSSIARSAQEHGQTGLVPT